MNRVPLGTRYFSMLEIKKLTQKYRFGVPAFSNLSFSVEKGELLCILGEEESGKTSLLKTLCGINRPESGKICLDGEDITDASIRDRNFFLVQDDLGFFPHKTLFYNLAYPMRIRRISEDTIREKISHLARKYSFENILDKKIAKIDLEARIIAAVSRAELRPASVFMFDNPFRKAPERERLFNQFLPFFDSVRQNAYVLYATDSLYEAETLSAKTLILHYGYAQGFGYPAELKYFPVSRYTFSLLHSHYSEQYGKIVKEGNIAYLQTETNRYTLSENALLNEIFIGKEVLLCSDENDIRLYDPTSEKLIYFEEIG